MQLKKCLPWACVIFSDHSLAQCRLAEHLQGLQYQMLVVLGLLWLEFTQVCTCDVRRIRKCLIIIFVDFRKYGAFCLGSFHKVFPVYSQIDIVSCFDLGRFVHGKNLFYIVL